MKLEFKFPGFKQPDAVLDYGINLFSMPVGDALVTAEASAAPSGVGELAIYSLTLLANTLVLRLAGGVPGRNYQVRVEGATLQGLTFECVVLLEMNPLFAIWPPSDPPSLGFGTPVIWTTAIVPVGPILATGLQCTGTNQATAAALPAQTNIATGGVIGGGFILPPVITGTIRFINAWTQDILIYPPGTAIIGTGGARVPAIVSAGGAANFSTGDAATQWYAS